MEGSRGSLTVQQNEKNRHTAAAFIYASMQAVLTWINRSQLEACNNSTLIGSKTMISLEDCTGLCGLEEDEVAATSEHEHISEVAATALGSSLGAAAW
jgi:hypothetical protein